MTFPRRLASPLALVAVGFALVPGCGSSASSTPRAAATVRLQNVSNAPAGRSCPAQSDSNHLGSVSTSLTTSDGVEDGSTQDGAPVTVQCSVKGDDAAGYEVTAQTQLAGKFTLTLNGKVTPTGASTLRATYITDFGTFIDNACVVSFPSDVAGPPVAPGRVRLNVDCENATDASQQSTLCDLAAQVKFENCLQ